MSKIFDAYRKNTGNEPGATTEVSPVALGVLFPRPMGHQADDFVWLANNLLNLRVEGRGTILSFASSESGEGSSFVSYNVAALLAESFGQRVAWIDGNFMSPKFKENKFPARSFAAMLSAGEIEEEFTQAGSLHLISGGDDLAAMRGLLAGERYAEIVRELAERFDFVFVDLPPVLRCSETAMMGAGTDGLLLVVTQKYLKWEVVKYGVEQLHEKGVTVLGSVINRREFVLPKFIYDRL